MLFQRDFGPPEKRQVHLLDQANLFLEVIIDLDNLLIVTSLNDDSVEFIIQRLAQGWTEAELLENYPRLTLKHLQAVFAYVQECIEDGLLISHSPKMDR